MKHSHPRPCREERADQPEGASGAGARLSVEASQIHRASDLLLGGCSGVLVTGTQVDGLARWGRSIAAALRSQAWEGGTARKLTPTQGQILVFLMERGLLPVRLSDVAEALCLTAATASDAVITLVEKKLVRKERSAEDQRALAITLTAATSEVEIYQHAFGLESVGRWGSG